MKRIYLDHAASSPLKPESRAAMRDALERLGANPSSLHAEGREARLLVEAARESVAALAGCDGEDLVFTSGGTEANRLALEGSLGLGSNPECRVAYSEADHPSVLGCVEDLERRGVPGRRLKLDEHGFLDPEPGMWDLGPGTGVLSLLWVNNETGVIQDATRIIPRMKALGWTVHVDAAQGIGKLDAGVLSEADLISFSAAKIGGPAGMGALVIREGAAWRAPWSGGKQEGRRRPGTEAALLAAGFGAAAGRAENGRWKMETMRGLEAAFLESLKAGGVSSKWNGPEKEGRLPGLFNLGFPRWEADQLCAALDLAGVAASAGAACSSGVVRSSPVLRAMGRSEAEARTGVRFSFGWNNTREEAAEAGKRVARVVGGPVRARVAAGG